ncbi:MAG TPA: HD domain-containing protein [Thermomicrobiales bacterium]|nr:HD domain-containing protein [Thermomicrobiales bacterium]
MNDQMRTHLEMEARQLIDGHDAAHDFEHARRVMANALSIGSIEGGDPDVLIPAGLFHDVVMYPKNDPRSESAARQSAKVAVTVLQATPDYPSEKIVLVVEAISNCSFHRESTHLHLDSLILQDADRLEATGAIAIMRTFWSAGQMGQPLYNPADPFAMSTQPDGLKYALDLFETRLFRVEDRLHTKTARQLAAKRSEFLHTFIEQLRNELRVVPRD